MSGEETAERAGDQLSGDMDHEEPTTLARQAVDAPSMLHWRMLSMRTWRGARETEHPVNARYLPVDLLC